jgi:hypothetical protein
MQVTLNVFTPLPSVAGPGYQAPCDACLIAQVVEAVPGSNLPPPDEMRTPACAGVFCLGSGELGDGAAERAAARDQLFSDPADRQQFFAGEVVDLVIFDAELCADRPRAAQEIVGQALSLLLGGVHGATSFNAMPRSVTE